MEEWNELGRYDDEFRSHGRSPATVMLIAYWDARGRASVNDPATSLKNRKNFSVSVSSQHQQGLVEGWWWDGQHHVEDVLMKSTFDLDVGKIISDAAGGSPQAVEQQEVPPSASVSTVEQRSCVLPADVILRGIQNFRLDRGWPAVEPAVSDVVAETGI